MELFPRYFIAQGEVGWQQKGRWLSSVSLIGSLKHSPQGACRSTISYLQQPLRSRSCGDGPIIVGLAQPERRPPKQINHAVKHHAQTPTIRIARSAWNTFPVQGVDHASPRHPGTDAAYQEVTHPIWDYTLGLVLEFWEIDLPWWGKDYLTIGVILAGASQRAWRTVELTEAAKSRSPLHRWLFSIFELVMGTIGWPFMVVGDLSHSFHVWRMTKAEYLLDKLGLDPNDADPKKISEVEAVEKRYLKENIRFWTVFTDWLFWSLLMIFVSHALIYFKLPM